MLQTLKDAIRFVQSLKENESDRRNEVETMDKIGTFQVRCGGCGTFFRAESRRRRNCPACCEAGIPEPRKYDRDEHAFSGHIHRGLKTEIL